jgi:hypothetical protein
MVKLLSWYWGIAGKWRQEGEVFVKIQHLV